MKLAIIVANNDDASRVYVTKKKEEGIRRGIQVEILLINEANAREDLKKCIHNCNTDPEIHGILLQLPLYNSINSSAQYFVNKIAPQKDVDCLTLTNQGVIASGHNKLLPCTAQAVYDMIRQNSNDHELSGEKVHIVGRSLLVGKSLAIALINAGASVTVWNSNFTKEQIEDSVSDDIINFNKVHFVSAIGQPEYFDFSWYNTMVENRKLGLEQVTCNTIKPVYQRNLDKLMNTLHIYDVGMNRDEHGKLCGDVKRNLNVAFQTPVPGGIGPRTVDNVFLNLTKLYHNTILEPGEENENE